MFFNCALVYIFPFFFKPIKVDSEEDDSLQFPSVSEVSDASLLLLKRKSNGKYTLFRVSNRRTVSKTGLNVSKIYIASALKICKCRN